MTTATSQIEEILQTTGSTSLLPSHCRQGQCKREWQFICKGQKNVDVCLGQCLVCHTSMVAKVCMYRANSLTLARQLSGKPEMSASEWIESSWSDDRQAEFLQQLGKLRRQHVLPYIVHMWGSCQFEFAPTDPINDPKIVIRDQTKYLTLCKLVLLEFSEWARGVSSVQDVINEASDFIADSIGQSDSSSVDESHDDDAKEEGPARKKIKLADDGKLALTAVPIQTNVNKAREYCFALLTTHDMILYLCHIFQLTGIRHHDLSPSNLLLQRVSREKALIRHVVAGTSYYVPNYGFRILVTDFELASQAKSPNLLFKTHAAQFEQSHGLCQESFANYDVHYCLNALFTQLVENGLTHTFEPDAKVQLDKFLDVALPSNLRGLETKCVKQYRLQSPGAVQKLTDHKELVQIINQLSPSQLLQHSYFDGYRQPPASSDMNKMVYASAYSDELLLGSGGSSPSRSNLSLPIQHAGIKRRRSQ